MGSLKPDEKGGFAQPSVRTTRRYVQNSIKSETMGAILRASRNAGRPVEWVLGGGNPRYSGEPWLVPNA